MPLRGLVPLATWKCLLFIARASRLYQVAPPGAAHRAQGIAQDVTRHRPISKLKLSRRESCCEARRDVGGDCGRRSDSGSRSVDWRQQRKGLVHQLQQATGQMAVIEQAGRARHQESEELTNHVQNGFPMAWRMVTGKSANQQ